MHVLWTNHLHFINRVILLEIIYRLDSGNINFIKVSERDSFEKYE